MKFSIGIFFLFFSILAIGQLSDSLKDERYNKFDDINETYTKNRYKVSINGSYGIYDSLGNEVLAPTFVWIADENPSLDTYSSGFIFAYKNDSTYLLNHNYELLLPYAYDFYCAIGTETDIGLVIGKNERIGIYLKEKGLVIPVKYKDAVVVNEFFLLKNQSDQIELFDFSGDGSKKPLNIVEMNRDYLNVKVNRTRNDGLLLIAESNEKFGVLNTDLDTIVDFEYAKAHLFIKGDFIYIKDNEKWSCIWAKNEWKRVPVQNIDLIKKGEFIFKNDIVSSKGRHGVIDHLGNNIIPLKYDEVLISNFYSYYLVRKGKEKGLFKADGEQLTKMTFEAFELFTNTQFLVSAKNKYGILGSRGEVIVPMKYDNIYHANTNYFKVRNDNKIGLLDSNGKVLFTPQFTKEIKREQGHLNRFSNNFQQFEKSNGEITTVNLNGLEIIPALYDTLVHSLTEVDATTYRSLHNYFLVRNEGLYGVVSGQKELISPVFEWIDEREFYLDTLIPFKRNGEMGYLALSDLTERYYGDYDVCQPFAGNYAFVSKVNKKGLIDRFGNVLLKPKYDSVALNYRRGSLNSRYINIHTFQTIDEKVESLMLKGLYDSKTKRFVIPLQYQGIKHVQGDNNPYYSALKHSGDTTYVYSLKGEGIPVFEIYGNPYRISFKAGKAGTESYFKTMRIDKNAEIRNVINYYDINGDAVLLDSLVIIDVSVEDVEISLVKKEKTKRDSLNEQYAVLNRITGANYYPKLFGLPEIYIAKKGELYGVIDANKKVLVPFYYDQIIQTTGSLLKVKKGTKFGWVTRTGDILLPLIYDNISPIHTARDYQINKPLFLLESNGEFGICDNLGELKIPAEYEELITEQRGISFQMSNAELTSEMGYGFNADNAFNPCSRPYQDSQAKAKLIRENALGYERQLQLLRENFAFPAKKKGLWGLVDINDDLILPSEYDSIVMLTGLVAQLYKEDQITFFDLEHRQDLPITCDTVFAWREPPRYYQNSWHRAEVLIFRSNGKYGMFNPLTKKILPAKYNAIEQHFPESDYHTFFKEDGLYLPEQKEKGNTDLHKCQFLARFKIDGKTGLINLELLEEISTKTYQHLKVESLGNSRAVALTLDNKMTFLRADSGRIFNALFDSVALLPARYNQYRYTRGMRNSLTYYCVEKERRVGLYDQNGNVIIPEIYDAIKSWIMLAESENDQFIVQKNGRFGVINQSGEILIPFKYEALSFDNNPSFQNQYELIENGIITYRSFLNL
ncbi:MAG: hypothetical protein GQ574_13305 [Crocinitomix sp.]|nr:hypothetical protein [Crocinitomix sp.]